MKSSTHSQHDEVVRYLPIFDFKDFDRLGLYIQYYKNDLFSIEVHLVSIYAPTELQKVHIHFFCKGEACVLAPAADCAYVRAHISKKPH